MVDSGIYDPRNDAIAPGTSEFWERSTATSDATFALPAVLPANSVSTKRKNENITGKRAPRKTAGATSKASHLIWIEEQGLPDLQSKITSQKHQLSEVTQDLANLDHQMRAIKIMKTREEFNLACKSHIDTKLQLRVRKAKIRKELQKLQRALN